MLAKLPQNPFKSGERLKPKAIPTFLGNVGLKKVVLVFMFRQSVHIRVQKSGTLGARTKKNKTTSISLTSPTNVGTAFVFKRLPLLDGF